MLPGEVALVERLVVGSVDKPQTIPREVTLPLPAEVTLPPDEAELEDIAVTAEVVSVGSCVEGSFSLVHDSNRTRIRIVCDLFII